jgi:hypothetical protein
MIRFVAAIALSALLANAASVFPGAHWATRDPATLGLDPIWLDRLAESLGGRGCVIKDGYLVKTWGSQSEIGDWLSSAKASAQYAADVRHQRRQGSESGHAHW